MNVRPIFFEENIKFRFNGTVFDDRANIDADKRVHYGMYIIKHYQEVEL